MTAARPNSPFGVFLTLVPHFDADDTGNAIELLIEKLDRMTPDPDLEEDDPDSSIEDDVRGFDPEEDCCVAGDDRVCSGAAVNFGGGGDDRAYLIGSEDDAEFDLRDLPPPNYEIDQTHPRNVSGRRYPGNDNG